MRKEFEKYFCNIQPDHYKKKIPPIDFIMANELDFCQGNIVKYVCRYMQKDGLKDLLKARTYLDYLISEYKSKYPESETKD